MDINVEGKPELKKAIEAWNALSNTQRAELLYIFIALEKEKKKEERKN